LCFKKDSLSGLARPAQIPVVTTKVSERGAALNKVRWSADGRRLLVGDVDGHTFVYEIGEVRAFGTPFRDQQKAK
jgi:hypothetical protein